jgi:hypothetical protein
MTARTRLARLAVRLDPGGRSRLARLAVRADETARARAAGIVVTEVPRVPLTSLVGRRRARSAADDPTRRRIALVAWVAATLLAFGGAFTARALERDGATPAPPAAALVAEPVRAAEAPTAAALEKVAPLPRIRPAEPRRRRSARRGPTAPAPPPAAPAPPPAAPAPPPAAPAPAPAPPPAEIRPSPAPVVVQPAPAPAPPPPRERFDSEG